MKILFATSECAPYIKSGGLADVLGSLPKALAANGHECTVVLPKYADMKLTDTLEFVTHYDIYAGWRKKYCGVFKAQADGVTYYFIDNEEYFGLKGLYGYPNDDERFAYFDFAVLELISHLQLDVDVLHLHDWQTAMISPLYKERYQYYPHYEDIKVVFTIHNIAFQGKADPKEINELFGLPQYLYENGNLQNDNCFNMMKAAILYSDMITTVSPTYAQEILTDEYGDGLQYILRERQNVLHGILNGIDYDINNPATDPHIAYPFDASNVKEMKVKNKLALQKEVGLPEDPDVPLIGFVSRLTAQKGCDLIDNQMETLMSRNCQVLFLGTGDKQYENSLAYFEAISDGNVKAVLKYDFKLSQRIYASCDMFLMPSKFEPCGLSQMMAMRYGTVPIVRETGGLKDSVHAFDEYAKTGTGFSFTNFNAHEMMGIIDYALKVYENKEDWDILVQNSMAEKLDWELSAKTYLSLFESMM